MCKFFAISKGGLLLLSGVLLFSVGNKGYGRKVAVDIGGTYNHESFVWFKRHF